MPRGFKKDVTTTKVLRVNGLLLDRRSFISLGAEPHLLLKGDDVVYQRQRVWLRSKGRCASCKRQLNTLDGCALQYDGVEWEMDHKQGGAAGRCDCLHNLQVLCLPCHREKHVQPQFTRKAEAVKAFDRLYPETA